LSNHFFVCFFAWRHSGRSVYLQFVNGEPLGAVQRMGIPSCHGCRCQLLAQDRVCLAVNAPLHWGIVKLARMSGPHIAGELAEETGVLTV
jgi:hypothetical protein